MGIALLVSRMTLAAVFLVAGVSKLLDRQGFTSVLRKTGLPSQLVPICALLLPSIEVLIAVGLVTSAWSEYAALGALLFLCVFVGAIVLNLARGRRVACNCFGSLSSGAMDLKAVGRNIGFSAVALFILTGGRLIELPVAVMSWIKSTVWAGSPLVITLAVVFLALVIQGYLLIYLLTQYGKLLSKLESLQKAVGPMEEMPPLPIGVPAPNFNVTALNGSPETLDSLLAARTPLMLVFLSADCKPCKALLPQLATWQHTLGDTVTVAAIGSGDSEAMQSMKDEHDLRLVLLQDGEEIAQAYRVMGTPSAILVNPDGSIASKLALGTIHVEELIREIVPTSAKPTPIQRIGA